jgi:hypothetical protein
LVGAWRIRNAIMDGNGTRFEALKLANTILLVLVVDGQFL